MDHKDTAAAPAAKIPIVDRRSLVVVVAKRQRGVEVARRTGKAVADTAARMAAEHIVQMEGAVVAGTSSTAAVVVVTGMKAEVVRRSMIEIQMVEAAAGVGGKVVETLLGEVVCSRRTATIAQ